MKTIIAKNTLVLLSCLLLQSCGSLSQMDKSLFSFKRWQTKEKKSVVTKTKYTFKDTFSSFDKEHITNDADIISNMIQIVQPELDAQTRTRYATDIHLALKKFNIAPQIMISIIDVESDFQYTKISSTGDLSIAQINPDIWNKEFAWMKKPLIDPNKLTTMKQTYAMEKMAKILSVLKTRHEKKDRRWYARYHSNTGKLKHTYLKKIDQRMKMLAKANVHQKTKQIDLAYNK